MMMRECQHTEEREIEEEEREANRENWAAIAVGKRARNEKI